MKGVVYVNNKASFSLKLYKKYTINDIKKLINENISDVDKIRFFLNEKEELNVFDNDKHDKLKLGSVWDKLSGPRFYIKTKLNYKKISNTAQNTNEKRSLTGIKDVDREILYKMSDKDILSICIVNKTYSNKICDETFFHNLILERYQETIPSKDYIQKRSWRNHYLNIVKYIDLLKTEFEYVYETKDKNPELFYKLKTFFKEFPYINNNYYLFYSLFKEKKIYLIKYLVELGLEEEHYLDVLNRSITNNLELLDYLIKNSPYELDYYKLMEQAFSADLQVVKYLSEKYSYNWTTVFLFACQNRANMENIKFFIKKGADIHVGNDQAFIYAVNSNNHSLVKFLLKNNFNVEMRDNEPLMIASGISADKMLKILIENGANVNARNGQALINAINGMRLPVIKTLLNNGANVNLNNGEGIFTAIRYRPLSVLKLLVEYGADMKTFGEEALRLAKESDKPSMIKYLESL